MTTFLIPSKPKRRRDSPDPQPVCSRCCLAPPGFPRICSPRLPSFSSPPFLPPPCFSMLVSPPFFFFRPFPECTGPLVRFCSITGLTPLFFYFCIFFKTPFLPFFSVLGTCPTSLQFFFTTFVMGTQRVSDSPFAVPLSLNLSSSRVWSVFKEF